MAVGHHLHDRAHVIKKSKNSKTGDEEVNQEFINMNESDAHAFDDEWQNEILKSLKTMKKAFVFSCGHLMRKPFLLLLIAMTGILIKPHSIS